MHRDKILKCKPQLVRFIIRIIILLTACEHEFSLDLNILDKFINKTKYLQRKHIRENYKKYNY